MSNERALFNYKTCHFIIEPSAVQGNTIEVNGKYSFNS